MNRSDARLIAEELHKLIRIEFAERLERAAAEAMDRILSIHQVAEMLGCAPKTIYNKIADIPHFKVGKSLRFSQAAITAYMKQRGMLN